MPNPKNKTRHECFIHEQKVRVAADLAFIKKNVKAGYYPETLSLPIGIQFELTSQCNLHCRHCYNSSSNDRLSEMTMTDWKKVSRDLISHGGIFQCILSGGEPLLMGPELLELMDPLADDGTGFVIITNGFLVNQQWVDKLKKFDYYWVQVSIDHLLKEKHDEFRGRQGSWEKAVNAAFLFSSAGLPLRIAHSLTPESLDYLEEFSEFCYQLGASTLICGEIMLSGRVDEHRELLMSDNDYEKMYRLTDDLRKKYAGRMEIMPSACETVEMRRRQKTPNSSVVIRPDGTVRLDCTMPFTIGNVLKKPFSAIWQEKGNTCWQSPDVAQYIRDLENLNHSIKHINHVTPDIEI